MGERSNFASTPGVDVNKNMKRLRGGHNAERLGAEEEKRGEKAFENSWAVGGKKRRSV